MAMAKEVALEDLSLPKTIDFQFEHKVFSVDGAVFRKTSDGDEIALFVSIGEAVAGIPIRQIQEVFSIGANTIDAKLLHYAAMGLKYVRQIYPGDSLPREVLLGTAPWMIDEKFREIARAKIRLQLAFWSTGDDIGELSLEEILEKAKDAAIEAEAEKAIDEISKKLEFGETVTDKVAETKELAERIAQELAYIEALREQLQKILNIQTRMRSFSSSYKNENSVHESITRCNTLVETPIKEAFEKFDDLDAYTCEILNTLRQFDAQATHIRQVRDELRDIYVMWEELIEKWDEKDTTKKGDAEFLIRETYQFAARHFVQSSEW